MGGTLGGFLFIRGGTVLRGGAGTGGKRFFLIFFFSLDTKNIHLLLYKTRKHTERETKFFFRLLRFSVGPLFSFGFFLDVLGFFIRRSIDFRF